MPLVGPRLVSAASAATVTSSSVERMPYLMIVDLLLMVLFISCFLKSIIIITYTTISGYLGASGCMVLSAFGSAWGTWRSGVGICKMGVDHPKGIIKNIVPIVMAGVLGIYGLIVSVIITQAISPPGGDQRNTYSVYNGYCHVSPKP